MIDAKLHTAFVVTIFSLGFDSIAHLSPTERRRAAVDLAAAVITDPRVELKMMNRRPAFSFGNSPKYL